MPPLGLVAVSLGLVVVLLALSAFICSPWHRHSRLSGQVCCFAAFEHAPGLQATVHSPLPPPVPLARQEACQQVARPPAVRHTAHAGRAPPA